LIDVFKHFPPPVLSGSGAPNRALQRQGKGSGLTPDLSRIYQHPDSFYFSW